MTRLTDRVVCVSYDGARLTEGEGVAARRIVTVLNGIDTERFFITPRAVRGPVVAVGRLSAEKDFATLIRAAAVAWQLDEIIGHLLAGSRAGAATGVERGGSQNSKTIGHRIPVTPHIVEGSTS
jgi:glycosyltransferase involved in cell wall biosynthesis